MSKFKFTKEETDTIQVGVDTAWGDVSLRLGPKEKSWQVFQIDEDGCAFIWRDSKWFPVGKLRKRTGIKWEIAPRGRDDD